MAYEAGVNPVKLDKWAQINWALLKRSIVLPHLITTVNGDQFKGALNDSVTVKVPGRAKARRRALRAEDANDGRKLTMDPISENSFQVSLDTNIYSGVPIEDEVLTMDIVDAQREVFTPQIEAIAVDYEDLIADAIEGASYVHNDVVINEAKPFESVVLAARALDAAWVPREGRTLIVGSNVATSLLLAEQFNRADSAGDAIASSRLASGTIGTIAGYRVVEVPALDPDSAFLFHKSAFAAATVTPSIPGGAAFGRQVPGGAAPSLTWIKDYDFEVSRDRSLFHFYAGVNVFEDKADSRVVGNDLVANGGLLRAIRLVLPST